MYEAQGGTCAICDQPCASGRRLAVDHDHVTNRIRGLLCAKCNSCLGWWEGQSRRVREYLGG